MLKTNEKHLVRIVVEGKVAPALCYPNTVGHDGAIHNVPSLGGITLNVLVGDPAFGWAADHVEPGVSSFLKSEKRTDRQNVAYNFLACVGNEAIVITGNAKGTRGAVVGHHGGAEHVMLDFPSRALERLTYEDRFQIRSFGQGLRLLDYPEIVVHSLDPRLLARMGLREAKDSLEVPVSAIVPGKLMGSGIGEQQAKTGDYDIMSSDPQLLRKHKLEDLGLGDIVAITDHDASFGWRYLEGACVIGVVVHGNSNLSGHGPGVCTIMTSPKGHLIPKIDPKANIGRMLKLGRFRKR